MCHAYLTQPPSAHKNPSLLQLRQKHNASASHVFLTSYANEGVSSLLLPPVRETKDASRGGKDLIHQIDQYCSERDHARSRIGLARNRLLSNEQKCVA